MSSLLYYFMITTSFRHGKWVRVSMAAIGKNCNIGKYKALIIKPAAIDNCDCRLVTKKSGTKVFKKTLSERYFWTVLWISQCKLQASLDLKRLHHCINALLFIVTGCHSFCLCCPPRTGGSSSDSSSGSTSNATPFPLLNEHRTSSVAVLRRRAREHSEAIVAAGTDRPGSPDQWFVCRLRPQEICSLLFFHGTALERQVWGIIREIHYHVLTGSAKIYSIGQIRQ